MELEIRREAGEKLTYNEKNNKFVYFAHSPKKADEIGLIRSRSARGPGGTQVWFTDEPFAALALWDVADDTARNKLSRLKSEFDKSYSTESPGDFPCPEGKQYMPYQRAGIQFGVDRGNCLIGDEPGLGKTVEAVGIANTLDARRILVVCPASIRLNWIREINSWSTLGNVRSRAILSGRDRLEEGFNYTVVSYELAKSERFHEYFCNDYFDLLILDEAHYLKTNTSQRTRSVFGGGRGRFQNFRLADAAERIIALTGTPLPNRPRECYTLARGLDWESINWLSYEKFCNRYNPSASFWSGRRWEAVGRLPELRARLRCNFMIRRHKSDVLLDLPDKRYEMSYIEPNGEIREILKREKLIDFDPDHIFNPKIEMNGEAIATLRREMGVAKIPRVVEHVKYILDILEIPKIVLFAHHRDVLNTLMNELSRYHPVLRMGGMGTSRQQAAIDMFVGNPDCRIFMGQLDTMEGADGLQHMTQYVIFAEPAWTPGRNEQCVDRLHRFGQHGNVIAQFLIAEGSMDEKVLHAVLGKAQVIHRTLDGDL